MGIRLDDAPALDTCAAERRLWDQLAASYQRLDAECAQAHCEARDLATELAETRWERNALVIAYGVVLVCLGVALARMAE